MPQQAEAATVLLLLLQLLQVAYKLGEGLRSSFAKLDLALEAGGVLSKLEVTPEMRDDAVSVPVSGEAKSERTQVGRGGVRPLRCGWWHTGHAEGCVGGHGV